MKYNPKDEKSILEYALKLKNKSFQQVVLESARDSGKDYEAYVNKFRKGGLGNLLEEVYFEYKANSNQDADFPDVGIELKTTPYELNKDGTLRAGERLVLTMISYDKPIESDFYRSHAWAKMRKILLICYLRNRELENRLEQMIHFVTLFEPPEVDLEIIKKDYAYIVKMIQSGRAHELSEGDTMYLGACTKGATAESSIVPQYYGEGIPAKKRAFCFKTSYMTYVLNQYVAGNESDNRIIKNTALLKEKSFEAVLEDIVGKYIGKSDKELCSMFGREYNGNKAQWNDLAFKILGIRDEHAEEFEKANIRVKTIRVEEKNTIKESMSFETFKFMDLMTEEFETSALHDLFDETRWFFFIWKKEGNVYKVHGCKLWHMPYSDLNVTVKREWEDCRKIIASGVKFAKKVDRNGKVSFSNNLPKKSETEIIHVRPHADQAAYRFKNGEEYGNVEKDANALPNGEYMTTQSFWLNNDYVLRQLGLTDKKTVDQI
jgi:DNA mismatch repair protein MutH